MSTAYDLGSCCLMGFVDDELNKLLGLDGIVEHSMYLITVGVNREE
jgi:nitroreductase